MKTPIAMYTIQYKKWKVDEVDFYGTKRKVVTGGYATLEGFTDFTSARKRALDIVKERMSVCNEHAYKAKEIQEYINGILHHRIRVWCGRHPYQVTIKGHAPEVKQNNELCEFLNEKPKTK